MKKILMLLIALIILLVNASGLRAGYGHQANVAADESVVRRFALVIGANNGGRGRVKLQYAVDDAKSILKVLENLGGVSPDDSRLLIETNRDTLLWEIKRLKERIDRARQQHKRIEVIFYYSGHSDEKNILLGKDKIAYEEFREEINSVDSDVRIAILDSCASGAFTRLKGERKDRLSW